jgi:hypothetical protein
VSGVKHTRERQVAVLTHDAPNVRVVGGDVGVPGGAEARGGRGLNGQADLLAADPYAHGQLLASWRDIGDGQLH